MSTNYEIREKLKSYKHFQEELCDDCGYEGSFGVTPTKVPGMVRIAVSGVALVVLWLIWENLLNQNAIAWFFMFPPLGAFYFYYMLRRDVVCPNCDSNRRRSQNEILFHDQNTYDHIIYEEQAEKNIEHILKYMEAFERTGKREKIL